MIALTGRGERAVRRTLQHFVRRVPPRNRGLAVVAQVDRLVPPSSVLLSARVHGGRSTIRCDLRDATQRSIFYRGRFEDRLTDIIERELRRGDVFVDAGANVGWYTHLAAHIVGPRGTVLAFEPAGAIAERLRIDLARSGLSNVEVHEIALLDRDGEAVLAHVHGMASPDGQRFIATDVDGDVVRHAKFDSLFPTVDVDVMKLDVEGAELRALHGMAALLDDQRRRPRLLALELIPGQLARFGDHEAELLTFLQERGYRGRALAHRHRAPMWLFRIETGAR